MNVTQDNIYWVRKWIRIEHKSQILFGCDFIPWWHICQMERMPICGTVTLTLPCYPNHLPGIPGRCYVMQEAFQTINYWPVYVKWLTSFNEKKQLPKLASFIHTLAFFDWLNLSPSLSRAWPPYKPGVLSHLHTLDPTASLHTPPPRLILPCHSHAFSRKAATTNCHAYLGKMTCSFWNYFTISLKLLVKKNCSFHCLSLWKSHENMPRPQKSPQWKIK